jgi:16S rRNA (guanine966-N2)-methyltransferase
MILKVISGKARGRTIKTPKNDTYLRPLLGRIKKSLFDILTFKLAGADFLDLFAGCGSVGIEAISRGAGSVLFIEKERKYSRLIKENLDTLGLGSTAAIETADVMRGLNWLDKKFDMIFVGVPYKDEKKRPLSLTSPVLKLIEEASILKDNGLIISQHHDKEQVIAPDSLELYRKEKYGDTLLEFFRKKLK